MSILFTKEGYEKLLIEEKNLIEKRKETLEHLKKAREMGDLSENGYYKAAKFELINIDRRLRECKRLIKTGKVVKPFSKFVVEIGSTVTIYDGLQNQKYRVVGEFESNPMDGRISYISPIGKALMGKRKGEIVTIETPKEKINITVIEID